MKAHINPFPGIRSFETNEHHLFFGREKQIDEIVSVLKETHFLALVGYSGCGKSSLIRAGVIPTIQNYGIQTEKAWTISVFKPGDDPIYSFALEYTRAYNKQASDRGDAMITHEEVEESLRTDSEPIIQAYQKLASGPWLIVIDQFEEVFRYHKKEEDLDKSESIKFVDLFLNTIKKGLDVPVYIILTMRSDFLDQCTELPGLTEAINKGHFLVPRMTANSLQEAIVEPIRSSGDEITDELVERLILDLGDKSDQLPVMQHALMRAWDYWSENKVGDQPLDLVHYEAVGTITSALSIHAEEIFDGFEREEQKNITERLFKALTNLGTDKKGTRRPTAFEDILRLTAASKSDLIEIIDQFRAPGRAFLMPPYHVALDNDTVVDISHESLMRVWNRLREWVDEETKSAELYLRLSKASELYQLGKTGPWTNPELEIAVNWRLKNKPNSFWAERYDPAFERAIEFLDYSKSESDFEIKKKENRQKRELSRARKIVIFLSLASIISILFLIVSLNLRFQAEASEEVALEKGLLAQEESKKAEKQRKEAIAQQRIAQQQQEIAEQQKLITEEQRQFALLQQDIARDNESKAKKSEASAIISEKKAKISEASAIESEQKAKISEASAIESEKKTKESEKNTKRLRLLAIARSMAIQSQRVASTNEELAVLLAGQSYDFIINNNGRTDDPDLFNALSSVIDNKPTYNGHKDVVREVGISDDGNLLFSCSDDGKMFVWNTNDLDADPVSLKTNGNSKNGIRCFSEKNNAVVSGTTEGMFLYWDKAVANTNSVGITAHTGIINKIEFIAKDKFVTAGADGLIKVWNIDDFTKPLFSKQLSGSIKDIALSHDGAKLACGMEDGVILIFGVAKFADAPQKLKTDQTIRSIALNSTGSTIAIGDAYGMINVIDLSSERSLDFLDHKSAITSLEYSADDKVLASSSYDNTIRIWNPTDAKQPPIVITDHDSWVMDIAFCKNGNNLISGSNDNSVMKFLVSPTLLSSKICGKISRNMTADEWNTFVGSDIDYKKTCSKTTSIKK